MSEETKRKISEANKGRAKSPEHRAKITASIEAFNASGARSRGNLGKEWNDEQRKKCSERQKGKVGKKHTLETRQKLSAIFSGEGGTNWKGGITEAQKRERFCLANDEWRKAVFLRDNFTCQKCDIRGCKLNAHHVQSWAEYPALRHETSNGITLCEKCHRAFHKAFGKKGNTQKQIEEFLKSK